MLHKPFERIWPWMFVTLAILFAVNLLAGCALVVRYVLD